MKLSPYLGSFAGLCLMATTLCGKGPVLATPGTASWTDQTTTTGTKTVFTLTGNTVLNWEQLNLAKGSEMEFNFVGGKTVVNFLNGTGSHFIDGKVTSNGIVAFFSPTADLQVNGSIIAKGVTLATLNVDPDDFSDGNGFELIGDGSSNSLGVNGIVQATDGDVVLGGEQIVIGGGGQIQASGDVMVGASRNFTVAPSGDRRINEKSGEGFVLHMGTMNASRIEVAAGREIYNEGTANAAGGRIFLRVGADGSVTNETSGILIGDIFLDGADVLTPSTEYPPVIDDPVSAVNEASLPFPKLSRPDGSPVVPVSAPASGSGSAAPASGPSDPAGTPVSPSAAPKSAIPGGGPQGSRSIVTPRTLTYSVPMSASSDAGRDVASVRRASRQMAQVGESSSLLQRSSFFGMRGGTSATAKR
jgi:hypothetical protein